MNQLDQRRQAMRVARQLSIPFASPENKMLRPERTKDLANLVPESFARRYNALPLFCEEDKLAIAMADPTNKECMQNLQLITRCAIQPFVAAPCDIQEAIDSFYNPPL
jgi:type IV pilus assembly protein PilB